jgi:hypothetical protein
MGGNVFCNLFWQGDYPGVTGSKNAVWTFEKVLIATGAGLRPPAGNTQAPGR